MLAVLHVEDDPALSDLVDLAFKHLGFSGEILRAESVVNALRTIHELTAQNRHLDLVIVDMNLPDGKGLEVIRYIKSNPSLALIPVLVLSSETARDTVAEAYTLGANCYIPKRYAGTCFFSIIEALYGCWFTHAVLPRSPSGNPTRHILGRTAGFKARLSEFYTRLATAFESVADLSRFWLELALNQANQANLISFMHESVGEKRVSNECLETLTKYNDVREPVLAHAQSLLAQTPQPTRDQAFGWALQVEGGFDPHAVAIALGALFPNVAAATQALKDSIASHLLELARGVLSRSLDPTLQRAARDLAEHAEKLQGIACSQTPP